MKKIIFLIIIVINAYFLYSIEVNQYDQILAGEIKVGKKEGEIGDISFFFNMGGMPLEYFTISKDDLLYVCDFINKRINIYNMNFEYIDKIDDNGKSSVFSASKILVNENSDIIAYVSSYGLVKIDKKGNEIYKLTNNELPQEIKSLMQYFLYDNNVLFYEDNDIKIINAKGRILKKTDAEAEIERINNYSTNKDLNIQNESTGKINTFLKEKRIVKYNDKLMTGKFDQLREYYKIYNEDQLKSSVAIKDKIDNINSFISTKNITLIGYDSAANSYWRTNTTKQYKSIPVILVCSKYGTILDCFYNSINLNSISIAPNGDVYFMDRKPKEGNYLFYKVERHW